MFRALRATAADIARRSALGLAGAILVIVALGFLTSAAWYALLIWNGPVSAGLILGGAYLLLGLVLMLLARDPSPAPPPQPEVSPMQRVVAAFFDGIEAGSQVRRPPPEDGSRRR